MAFNLPDRRTNLESKVRFFYARNKWQAFVRYRGADGTYVWRSRLFPTKDEADEGLRILVADNRSASLAFPAKIEALLPSGEKWSPYRCPLCKEKKLFNNRRITRLDGVATAVCKGCYKGPHG